MDEDVESIGLNGRTTVHQTDLCWGKKALDNPAIKNILDGAGKNQLTHGVKLTSQGWEAKGLDSVF